MENTLENKAKFFAQYWGSKAVIYSNGCWKPVEEKVHSFKSEESIILLTPLELISDEDAIEVAEIINISNYDFIEVFEDNNSTAIKSIITSKKDGDCYGGIVCLFSDGTIYWDYHNRDKYGQYEIRLLNAYDFLRSKGYALPFMGLSVEQLVSYGWVKIKQQ